MNAPFCSGTSDSCKAPQQLSNKGLLSGFLSYILHIVLLTFFKSIIGRRQFKRKYCNITTWWCNRLNEPPSSLWLCKLSNDPFLTNSLSHCYLLYGRRCRFPFSLSRGTSACPTPPGTPTWWGCTSITTANVKRRQQTERSRPACGQNFPVTIEPSSSQ